MGDLKTRLTTLLRRGSSNSSKTLASLKSTASSGEPPALHPPNRPSSLKLPDVSTNTADHDDDLHNLDHSGSLSARSQSSPASNLSRGTESLKSKDRPTLADSIAEEPPAEDAQPPVAPGLPAVTLEEPTPIPIPAKSASLKTPQSQLEDTNFHGSDVATPLRSRAPKGTKPNQLEAPAIVRRQSLVTTSNARIIKTLLDSDHQPESASIALGPASQDYFAAGNSTFTAGMLHRKIWVKRAHASATLVQVREDDLVDDVREMILKKYANSLGRNFDAPDVTLRIFPRDGNQKAGDRVLGPDEEMCRTIDAYYPGGQTVNEALIIDVPHKRTPRPSPRAIQQGVPYYYDQSNPIENAAEYFPPMPVVNPSPAAMTSASHDSRASMSHVPQQHSIAVLNTGQLPPLPSPGGTRRGHHSLRPKYPRQNTASPTTMGNSTASLNSSTRTNNSRPRHDSTASEAKHPAHAIVPIPTPPAAEGAPLIKQESSPPTPRVSSPRPKNRKKKGTGLDTPSLPSGLLDGSVPPINVLIVEDNIINLRVLGAFMERLKVRWQRAMNGREAVTKWRSGGFHLVLMDIQLPIMNGLEATKEIRRLERVNSIGVFSSGNHVAPKLAEEKEIPAEDKLADGLLFKSPVIIVALTASSLQSDRHEALAAGCNDFLTKPVNFVWLERKVKEWGCMQALIDFDGWRKWKDFAAQSDNSKSTSKLTSSFSINTSKKAKAGSNLSPNSATNPANGVNGTSGTAAAAAASKAKKKEEDKKKRDSIGMGGPVVEEKESESPSPLDNSGVLT
ncbi:hypothetical protein BU16DRAFT_96266 [Lophium mytilinum]|uniref:Response regulatory domain-containing protein n=1 Tax=Lophium mytilinum TaxID=390894 RepID=A0A6A6QL44_9PEZI|nr:hypothetical protein BU16DRAFT_96266 [Lophium mytilinum]